MLKGPYKTHLNRDFRGNVLIIYQLRKFSSRKANQSDVCKGLFCISLVTFVCDLMSVNTVDHFKCVKIQPSNHLLFYCILYYESAFAN